MSENKDDAMCYVATATCGCTVAVTVDTPGHSRLTASDVSAFIRDGLSVDRMTVGEFKAKPFGHTCKPKQATLGGMGIEVDP